MAKCRCGNEGWMLYDARGIPCGTVCDDCEEEVRSGFRSDIFTDPGYWADEAIEPEDYYRQEEAACFVVHVGREKP